MVFHELPNAIRPSRELVDGSIAGSWSDCRGKAIHQWDHRKHGGLRVLRGRRREVGSLRCSDLSGVFSDQRVLSRSSGTAWCELLVLVPTGAWCQRTTAPLERARLWGVWGRQGMLSHWLLLLLSTAGE